MSNIKVQCIDQAIGFLNTPVISSGNVNYDTITFDFCSKWDGFAKTAIFYRTKDEVYYGILDETNSCLIPREVLSDKGTFYIGVFGSKDDVTITSAVLAYKVQEGAITENTKPSDPTPDIYDQLIAKYADYNSKLDSQIERMDEIEKRLDTGVGDAEKFGGQLPSYYATAQSVTDLTKGTTPVGNSNKLGDKSADEYLLKSGGELTGQLKFSTLGHKTNSDAGYSADQYGNLQHQRADASDYFQYKSSDGSIILKYYPETGEMVVPGNLRFDGQQTIHAGNIKEYALLKSGGKVGTDGSVPFMVENTGSGNVMIDFLVNGVRQGLFGFDGVDNPIFYDSTHSEHNFIHSGNVGDYALPKNGGTLTGPLKFAQAFVQNTKPTVVATFVDNNSANGLTYSSMDTLWSQFGSSKVVPVNVDPGVGASVTYADGTVLFVYEEE